MNKIVTSIFAIGIIAMANTATACTGITLTAADKSFVLARTVDWSGSEMDNLYVISPRNHTEQSLLPNGSKDGMKFTSKYGFVGLGMQRPEFIVDGTNEAGLSAALFYFPDYGKYVPYSSKDNATTLADFQVVSWILSNFLSIEKVESPEYTFHGLRLIVLDKSHVQSVLQETLLVIAFKEIASLVADLFDGLVNQGLVGGRHRKIVLHQIQQVEAAVQEALGALDGLEYLRRETFNKLQRFKLLFKSVFSRVFFGAGFKNFRSRVRQGVNRVSHAVNEAAAVICFFINDLCQV